MPHSPSCTSWTKALRTACPVRFAGLWSFLLAGLLTACTSSQHLRNVERYGEIPNEIYVGRRTNNQASGSEKPLNKTSATAHAAALRLGITPDRHDDVTLLEACAAWLGTPYAYGGNSRKGVDCSGLTCQIFSAVYGKKLHRRSADQYEKDVTLKRREHLRPGDLVFFTSPGSRGRCGHVGIFLKDGKFIHASSTRGVVVNHLDERYWRENWLGGGRVR